MSETTATIAVVTGASRGAGRGIALALGRTGATVYVTGRSEKAGDAPLPGTIYEAAEAVTAAGGKGVAVRVDHADDTQVKALFERVAAEQGRLDLLVNNVAAIHDDLIRPGPFWEKSLELARIIDVGLRSQYVASFYAAPLLTKRPGGLIVFTSSFGSSCYMHGPAYGAQKAGVDKLAADMAVDFRDFGAASVSIWMGILLTERTRAAAASRPDQYGAALCVAESPEFTGRLISALHRDPELMSFSGQTLIGAELALRYGIRDDDGKQPRSRRDLLGSPRVPHPAIVG